MADADLVREKNTASSNQQNRVIVPNVIYQNTKGEVV